MKINYVLRNYEIGDYQKDQISKKVERLDKYFSEDVKATVTLDKVGTKEVAEVTIFLPGAVLRAEEESDAILTSIDRAIDGLISQIRKYKTKLQNRYQKNASIRFESFENDVKEENDNNDPKIVRVKKIEIKPMSPEEAVLQMELVGHDFFVFQDGETFETSIVYKRRKGDYGLIEPETDVRY